MYENFFGFSGRPFNLVPNPQYLYLGASHKEVLAHLTYAVSTNEGFVAITGEVGTGKTTLCRAFLNNLDSSVEAAYIFNPSLDAIGLMQAINSEYGLEASSNNLNELIGALNLFLMGKNSSGKQVILIIDEAQNLAKPVLEQLRLLSNLETHQSKLIQIILVGQPELEATLKSHELRQLRQRINLFWRLSALSADETRNYVLHRLDIATTTLDIVFKPQGFGLIHRYSSGVPRLINIICDRALIVAFGERKTTITAKMIKKAVLEVGFQDKLPTKPGTVKAKAAAAFFIFLTSAAILTGKNIPFGPEHPTIAAGQMHQTHKGRRSPSQDEPAAAEISPKPVSPPTEPAPAAAIVAHSNSPSKPRPEFGGDLDQAKTIPRKHPRFQKPKALLKLSATPGRPKPLASPPHLQIETLKKGRNQNQQGDFKALLKDIDPQTNRSQAMLSAMQLWVEKPTIKKKLARTPNDLVFFEQAAADNGLAIHAVLGGSNTLQRFNLPALLELTPPKATNACYVILKHVHQNHIIVSVSSGPQQKNIFLAPDDIAPYWSGAAYILWKPLLNSEHTIHPDAKARTIKDLKRLLRHLGYAELDKSAEYDQNTRAAVIKLQRKYGLKASGVVDIGTHIALYREHCAKQGTAPLTRLPPLLNKAKPDDVINSVQKRQT